MVLSCLLDETVQAYCTSCIDSRKPVEVGVLVGRAAGSKVLILKAAPTPAQDGIPPVSLQQGAHTAAPKKQGGKHKGQPAGGLVVDKEWVVEHAAQVVGMLPGGLDVVGLYLLCPEGSFSAASGLLLSLLHETQRELGGQPQELVLLHIDAVTGKLAAREFTGGQAGSLKPCNLKPSNLLAGMVPVHCRLPTTISLQLTNPKQRLRDALAAAVEQHLQQLVQPAVGLLVGQLSPPEMPLLDLPTHPPSGSGPEREPGANSGGAVEPHIQLELLLPLDAGSPALLAADPGSLLHRGKGRQETVGEVRVEGVLDCRTYLQRREGAGAAVEAIKQDASRTLHSRLSMLAELAEQQQEDAAAAVAAAAAGTEQQEQQLSGGKAPPLLRRVSEGAALAVQLPHRVFLPGPGGAFCFCDHLMEGEGLESAVGRAEELLGLQLGGAGTVECLEVSSQEQGRKAGGPTGKAAAGSGTAASSLYCNAVALGAAGAAGLALLLGYMSLGQQ